MKFLLQLKRIFTKSLKNRLIIAVCFSVLLSCKNEVKPDFKEWYSENKSTINTSKDTIYEAIFESSTLNIDTIYRSMQGPYQIKQLSPSKKSDELIWIIGYKAEIFDAYSDTILPDKYMCHNNLNYSNSTDWQLKTTGSNSRIFTLSEGQTTFMFPASFGIPMKANQALNMVSQVLNHVEKQIDIATKHRTTLYYIKDNERTNEMKPMYQQSVFVTKQTSGPAGDFGLPKLCVSHHLDSGTISGKKPNHNCEIDFSSQKYNPYEDAHGRKYTGHWKLTNSLDTLSTDVSAMLDLKKKTTAHAIGVHLHPFAEALELWDATNNILLYKADVEQHKNMLGFENISYYKSLEGILLSPENNYKLLSVYHCTDTVEQHTAMAVMYMYLLDN